jgi:squalene-associated FAD-dependent desaturase
VVAYALTRAAGGPFSMSHTPRRGPAIVIGAGVAGLSAAIRLADAGFAVTVLERAPRGGGRASAFTDRETGERVDNGQHVLFGCYRETYAFLDRIGAAHLAPLQPRLTLAMAREDGRQFTLTCPDFRPPWHLVAGVMRWRALSFIDRLAILRVGAVIQRARRHGASTVARDVPQDWTVSQWLAAHGQTHGLCEWLWHPLAFAALNQSPDVAAAAPFVRVVAELFGPRVEDSSVGLSRVPLDELFVTPAVRALESLGGVVRFKTEARVIVGGDARVRSVRTADGDIEAGVVVSAVPWFAFGDLWPDGPPPAIADIADRASRMESSPIVTVNVWLDGPVLPQPFVGLVRGPMHWAFDKRTIVGESARHLSIVSSGAVDLVNRDNTAITAAAVAQLSSALPEMRSRRVLRSVVVREHRASFSLAPGGPARPSATTPIAGFYLAGDWTNTELPATIEGAALSGRIAADAIVAAL